MQSLLSSMRMPLLILAISAAAAPAVSYAQNAPRRQQAQGRAGARPQAGERLQQVIDKLDLTDEQKTKLSPVMDELRKEVRTAMQSSAAPADRRKQIGDATATARKQIGEILTPEQRTKLAELLRDQRTAATQPTTQASPRAGMIARIEGIAMGLDLTPQQQTQVKDLSKEYRDEVAAIARDSAGNRGGNRQMLTVVQEYRSRLTQLLTPEQTDQFNRKLEEVRPARAANGPQARQGGNRARRTNQVQ